MARHLLDDFISDTGAAVAATYALALTGLVAVAGVGFDVARLATMDSELQAAADQAALAGATQLDGSDQAMENAVLQANNLVENSTIFAKLSGKVVIESVIFYKTKSDAEAGTGGFTDVTRDADAHFVRVTTQAREAYYALTPIVGAFRSGDIVANATAGLGSAICKVPPVMICNPAEGTDPEFTTNYVGKGLALISVGGKPGDNGSGPWAPGNFGYLDTGSTESNKIIALRQALGWDSPPGDCLPQDGVDTQTGANTPVTDAINTRFDIFTDTGPGGGACPTGGACTPSINSVKDLVRDSSSNKCAITPGGWEEAKSPYLPSPSTRLPVTTPTAMGHPRDICHAVQSSGICDTTSSRVGDGIWDTATYFAVNYPGFNWQSAMNLEYSTTTPTRHQVYLWEIKHRNDTYLNSATGTSTTIGAPRNAEAGKGKSFSQDYNQPICFAGTPNNPVTDGIDRRTFPVAVVNCTAESVNGNSKDVTVKKWMNVFLVEPSASRTRTGAQDVYVEVVSVNTVGGNAGGANQLIRRDKPYLVN